jgi:hypothetical protein
MEHRDESLTTRDLAGTAPEAPSEPEPDRASAPAQDARFERDAAARDVAAAHVDAPTTEAPTAEPESGATPREPFAEATEPAVDDRDCQEAPAPAAAANVDQAAAVLPDDEEADFLGRWEEIQTRFVDDPRQAVEDADALVAGVMQRIAEGFAQARDGLEGQWSRGEDVGTEELRIVLQRYRAFFRRLLSA